MTEERELPAFTRPEVTRRCRCGCVLTLAVPRRLVEGELRHDEPVVVRESCYEHRLVKVFRAEEKAREQKRPATMSTIDWLVAEINREVG